ncbi:MAG: hypothetical protein QM770_21715 [Tepidisphaeraceae bacterium]
MVRSRRRTRLTAIIILLAAPDDMACRALRSESMFTRSSIIVGLVFAAGALLGCEGSRSAQPATTWTPPTRQPVSSTQPAAQGPEYLNVLEAVFRFQFDHNASGARRKVDYFFLTLDRSDPPADLLARFKDDAPRVLPASLAKASAGEGVKHKDLGGQGLIFNITSIAWLDANTADVQGGYYEAGLSASGNTYRVERRGGKWVVTHNKMHWIS